MALTNTHKTAMLRTNTKLAGRAMVCFQFVLQGEEKCNTIYLAETVLTWLKETDETSLQNTLGTHAHTMEKKNQWKLAKTQKAFHLFLVL